MNQGTKQQLLRIVVAGGVIVVSWVVFLAVGAGLVDQKAIIKWLTENDWLKFLNPNIRDALVHYGWQLFMGLALGVFSYRHVADPLAGYIARKYFGKGPFADLRWTSNGFGLPQPEFILILPGNGHSCVLVLTNKWPGSAKINRIELEADIYRQYTSQSGSTMSVAVPLLSLESERNDIGLEWKKLSKALWVIDTPFTVKEAEEVYLPVLAPGTGELDNGETVELRKLVGLATLEIEFKVAILADRQTVNASLSAPLRIFLPLDEDDDGGVGALVSALNVQEASERDSLRDSYQESRRYDADVRKGFADQFNEWQEMESLQSHSEEIGPYDQAIELQPNDPNAHFARGHMLAGMGFPTTALGSLEKAAELGLDDPDLHLDRATVLVDLSRSEDAINALERVFGKGRNEALAYITKGRALNDLRRYEDALDAFKCAIELDPNLAAAHHYRGIALSSLGSDEEAIRAFDRAIEIDPVRPAPYVELAFALIGQNRDNEIIAALSKALGLGFSDLDVLMIFKKELGDDARTKFLRVLKSYKLESTSGNEDVES